MAFRMRGGCGGQRGRPIANAQVLEVMERVTTRLEAIELRNQGNNPKGDVSEPEIESPDAEEAIILTPEMRFLKNVFGSSSKPRPEVPFIKGILFQKN